MKVRYWRDGEVEREEEAAGPRRCRELPTVVVRPFGVMAGSEELEREPTLMADGYQLAGAMEHSKKGVVCAEYVYTGAAITRVRQVGRE